MVSRDVCEGGLHYDRSRDTPTLIHDHSKIRRAAPRRDRRTRNVSRSGASRSNRLDRRTPARDRQAGAPSLARARVASVVEARIDRASCTRNRSKAAGIRSFVTRPRANASTWRDSVAGSFTHREDDLRWTTQQNAPVPQSAAAGSTRFLTANPLPRFDTQTTRQLFATSRTTARQRESRTPARQWVIPAERGGINLIGTGVGVSICRKSMCISTRYDLSRYRYKRSIYVANLQPARFILKN